MATIVTKYDPWREKLLTGLGVNLLSGAIQRGQAADTERKKNALYTKTLQDLGLISGEQTQAQPYADPLMINQSIPKSYNNNGWAKTMHDSYTPMTAFNLGTAGLATQPQQQETNNSLSQMEFLKALGKNIATPRFNMVNFKDVYSQMLKPTMDAETTEYDTRLAEQQRTMQQHYSDLLLDAQDSDTYGKILNAYFASGYAPKEGVNAMQKNYEHLYPHYEKGSFDAGETIYPYSYDPLTGGYQYPTDKKGNLAGIPKTATPDKENELIFKYANMHNTNEQNERERTNKLITEDIKGTKYELVTKGTLTHLVRTGPSDPEGTIVKTFNHVPTEKEIAETKKIVAETANYNSLARRRDTQPDFFMQADYKSLIEKGDNLSEERAKVTTKLGKIEEELRELLKINGVENSSQVKSLLAEKESLNQQIQDIDRQGQELEKKKQQYKQANKTLPKDVIFETPLPPVGQETIGQPPLSEDILAPAATSSTDVSGNNISPAVLSPDVPVLIDSPVPTAILPAPLSGDNIRSMVKSPNVPNVLYSDPLLSSDTPAQSKDDAPTPRYSIKLNLPKEMFYDPKRDAKIKPEKIIDNARFKELIIKYGAAANDISRIFKKYGYKYKR